MSEYNTRHPCFHIERSSSVSLQPISLTQAESGEIYIPTVWWIQSPQTVPLPFLLGFLHFPKRNERLKRIWHKRFFLHPLPPINRTWQGKKKTVNVKSTANSIKDSPSGVKTNQDSSIRRRNGSWEGMLPVTCHET